MSVSPSCKDNETNSIQQNDCEWVRALRSLQTVDAFVANALSLLEEQGELANTYVFFYTDNGNHWGEHRLDVRYRRRNLRAGGRELRAAEEWTVLSESA